MRGGRYLMAAAGLGVLAAGCGTQVPQSSLTAAVTRTAGQTARIAETTTMRSPGMSMSVTAAGAFDFARSRGMISMRAPVGMTEIFIPPTTYIKVPGGAGAPVPHGKSWVAVDAGTAGGPMGSLFGPFGGESSNPADLLSSLTAISTSVTRLGTATVRGVQVTGYRVNIDPAKVAARLPRARRAGFRDFASILGNGSIPVDVWVDGQNLVRQLRVTLHLPGGTGAPAHAQIVQTTDFSDYGAPVHVTAPPAAQVASLSQLMKGGALGGGFPGSQHPPKVSGTISPAQSAAAGQVVSAFWAALNKHDAGTVAQTVPPSQRACVRSFMSSGPKITATSFRLVSVQPAGTGRATVRFQVKAQASISGHAIPVFPGAGATQWLVARETGGHWYVDLAANSNFIFGGPC